MSVKLARSSGLISIATMASRVLGVAREMVLAAFFGASGGIPRIINLLCDMALVYGYADQKPKIDADTVNEMLEDKAREGGWLFSRPRQRRASHSQGGD